MARQRASQAQAAFARVGTAPVEPVPADEPLGENASFSASGNAVSIVSTPDISNDGGNAGGIAARKASSSASVSDGVSDGGKAGGVDAGKESVKASRITGPRAGRKAGKNQQRRRVGRPRGPDRVPVTVRLMVETNDRLTTAVDSTGESPQYIVERALTAYLDALGVPSVSRRPVSA